MKKLFCFILVSVCMISCSRIYTYRQIGTLTAENLKMGDKGYEYKHSDFTISYDFWSYGGDVSFVVANHSDKDIYLLNDQSFFVVNGWAEDYYKNRTYVVSSASSSSIATTAGANVNANAQLSGELSGSTQFRLNSPTSNVYYSNATVGYGVSKMATNTMSHSSQSGHAVETPEPKTICIPAHSSKRFSQFSVMRSPYRACGFARDPSESGGVHWNFSSALDSPRAIENRLVFNVNGEIVPIVNTFYISQLTNIRSDLSYIEEYSKDCNGRNKSEFKDVRIEKMAAPNKFYTSYTCEVGVDNDRIATRKNVSVVAENKDPKSSPGYATEFGGVKCVVIKIDGSRCILATDSYIGKTWNEAIAYCASLGADWRLPSKEELDHLQNVFKLTADIGVWVNSDTTETKAELYYPKYRETFIVKKSKEYYVIPVISTDISNVK